MDACIVFLVVSLHITPKIRSVELRMPADQLVQLLARNNPILFCQRNMFHTKLVLGVCLLVMAHYVAPTAGKISGQTHTWHIHAVDALDQSSCYA